MYTACGVPADLKACLPSIHLVPGTSSCRDTICGGAAVHIAWLQEHVDHDVVQVSVGAADPLGYNENAEVAEQGVQEDHLGDELADDGQLVAEVALVEEGQDHTNVHLGHTCAAPEAVFNKGNNCVCGLLWTLNCHIRI